MLTGARLRVYTGDLRALGRGPRTDAAGPRRAVAMRAGGAHLTVPYTELEAGLAKLDALPAPRFVVFTADPDPATGLPWCPDCVSTLPAVRRTMADRGASLLEVGVGGRGDWKGNAAHPCRTDARFKVGGVPTLVAWPGGARMGAELEDAKSVGEAVALVAKFIAEAS